MKRSFMSTLCLALALALAQTAFAETLKKPELDKLVAAQQAKPSPNFRAFLADAAKAEPMLKASCRGLRKESAACGRRPDQHQPPAWPVQPAA